MAHPSALSACRALDALTADVDALRSASALVLGGLRRACRSATLAHLVRAARVPSAYGHLDGQARFSPLHAPQYALNTLISTLTRHMHVSFQSGW